MSTGWVYVLSNPSIPSQVKVGWTKGRPEDRAKELQGTGVPTPFEAETAFLFSNNADKVERKSHELLREVRVSSGREFFECDPQFGAEKILDAAKILGEKIYKTEPVLLTDAELRAKAEQARRNAEEAELRRIEEFRKAKEENKKRRQEAKRRANLQKEQIARLELQHLENASKDEKWSGCVFFPIMLMGGRISICT